MMNYDLRNSVILELNSLESSAQAAPVDSVRKVDVCVNTID